MSDPSDNITEQINECRNLAEELLREMPDMKDEIDLQLNTPRRKSLEKGLVATTALADVAATTVMEKPKTSLDELKRFRICRKRETDVTAAAVAPSKHLKLDKLGRVTERKSIIEIRITNEDPSGGDDKNDRKSPDILKGIRDLREQCIVELDKLGKNDKEPVAMNIKKTVLADEKKQEENEKQQLLAAKLKTNEKVELPLPIPVVKEEPKEEKCNNGNGTIEIEIKKENQELPKPIEMGNGTIKIEIKEKNQEDCKSDNIELSDNIKNLEVTKNNIDKKKDLTGADCEKHATNVPTVTAVSITQVKTKLHDNNSHQSENEFDEDDTPQPPEKLTAEEEIRDQELRASGTTFLQHLPCFKLQSNSSDIKIDEPNVTATGKKHLKNSNNTKSDSNSSTTSKDINIPRCRECRRRNVAVQAQTPNNDISCRFYEFRRLQYNAEGQLQVAGFPNPYTEPTRADLNIWQPDKTTEPTAGFMDIQVCRYILLHAGDQFCYLWRQEAEALKLHENTANSTIAWKKVVQGVREICDVCDTTLFNYHWTCDKCGFGVCLDCFKDRKEQRTVRKTPPKTGATGSFGGVAQTGPALQRGRDEFHWLLCTAQSKHALSELMLTQIIAGDALQVLGRLMHDVRTLWQVPQVCGCLLSKQKLSADPELTDLIQDMIKESQLKQQTSASSLATEATLRQQERMELLHAHKLQFARAKGIDYVPGRVWTKQTLGKDPITTAFDNFKHINFLRKGLAGLRRFLPPRAMTLAHSTLLAPGVPHEWLCDGKLLRLTNAMHPDNRILYQEVWKCGQPVMISEVARSLNLDLWRPEAFCNDFGDKPNDLINCLNGNLVPNQPMRHFWEGFQCIGKRLLDANGKPMLLKLKDWPPGDDFAEILPTRYADLMTGLPMPEYTLRTGNLNIASCLPKMFVPPDLGPKMYNAYGSALHPDKGTTNLHLDISDAVNIMVYVGIPQDSDRPRQLSATQRAIAMGGCDYITRARVQSKEVLPGALWHIFPARDADKIRDLLNRVTLEKGFRLEPDHDPIHDQNWYLDDKLRARLFKEYGVEGYPIVQCLGDAVFIPAGAPHQVQNLHNCIKVAEDFVSPENITHCYHLTHEFRRLSHSHTNHEDKLQIKNIIYHAIKDCCTILVRALNERIDSELEEQQKLLDHQLQQQQEAA